MWNQSRMCSETGTHQAGGEQTESRVTRFDVARTQQPKSTVAYGSLRFGRLHYQLKRTIGMVHKPDNSQCSRHPVYRSYCKTRNSSWFMTPHEVVRHLASECFPLIWDGFAKEPEDRTRELLLCRIMPIVCYELVHDRP